MMASPGFYDELPVEFDPDVYVVHPTNADLQGLDGEQARHHYSAYGRVEGRVCSTVDGRKAFLSLIPPDGTLLSIEPAIPLNVDLAGRTVRRLADRTTAELREAVKRAGADPALAPEVDLVWRGEAYLELTRERFDAALAIHSLERQPCLITHLTNVASVLKLGARFFLVIADRSFGAAHYAPDSTLVDVLGAYAAHRHRHIACNLIASQLITTHDDAPRHWAGLHGPDPRQRKADDAMRKEITELLRSIRSGPPDGATPAWHFTPKSFQYLIDTLDALGLSPFRIERLYWTIRPGADFYTVLSVVA